MLLITTSVEASWDTYKYNSNRECYIGDGLIAPSPLSFHGTISSLSSGINLSSPVIIDNYVYAGTQNGKIVKVVIGTGVTLATEYVQTGGPVFAPPLMHNGILYVGSVDGYLYAINSVDMSEKWRFKASAGITASALYVTDASGGDKIIFPDNSGKVFKIMLDSSGNISSSTSLELNDYIFVSPAAGDKIVMTSASGKAYVVDKNITAMTAIQLAAVNAVNPVMRNATRFYTTDFDGNLSLLNDTGAILAVAPAQNRLLASPLYDGLNDKLSVISINPENSDTFVSVFNGDLAPIATPALLPVQLNGEAIMTTSSIIAAGKNNEIYVLDRDNLQVVYVATVGANINNSLALDGYVVSYDSGGNITVFSRETATPTNSSTPTETETFTDTETETPTVTETFTNTLTNSSTDTETYTETPTATSTDTNTFTDTPTETHTNTSTNTKTTTATPTLTFTETETFTYTASDTLTETKTYTETCTFTQTTTDTFTNTGTYTDTYTETFTFTVTATLTTTSTPTPWAVWAQDGNTSQKTNLSLYLGFTGSVATGNRNYVLFNSIPPVSENPMIGNISIDNEGNVYCQTNDEPSYIFKYNSDLTELLSVTTNNALNPPDTIRIILDRDNRVIYANYSQAPDGGLYAVSTLSPTPVVLISDAMSGKAIVTDKDGYIYYINTSNELSKVNIPSGPICTPTVVYTVTGVYSDVSVDNDGNVYYLAPCCATPGAVSLHKINSNAQPVATAQIMDNESPGLDSYAWGSKNILIAESQSSPVIYVMLSKALAAGNPESGKFKYFVYDKNTLNLLDVVDTGYSSGLFMEAPARMGAVKPDSDKVVFVGGPTRNKLYAYYSNSLASDKIELFTSSDGPITTDTVSDAGRRLFFGTYNNFYAFFHPSYQSTPYVEPGKKYNIAIGKNSKVYFDCDNKLVAYGDGITIPTPVPTLTPPADSYVVSVTNGIELVCGTNPQDVCNFYRAGSPYELVNTNGPASMFVDTSVTAGTTYTYIVTKIDSYDQESDPSEPIVITYNPPTPTGTNTNTVTYTPTITPTMTTTFTPSATSTNTVSLSLYYKGYVTGEVTNNPNPQVKLYNNDSASLALSRVEIRYWYSIDSPVAQETAVVDWAAVMPNSGTVTAVPVIISGSYAWGQDRYFRITFGTASTAINSGEWLQAEFRFNKTGWYDYQQSNDWSFGTHSDSILWNKITVYVDGTIAWGSEPSGEVPTTTSTVTATHTLTNTPTMTASNTATASRTQTNSNTPTQTETFTTTNTHTATSTHTHTTTLTPTATVTNTIAVTATNTATPRPGAQVASVAVSGCYTAGQDITVTFQAKPSTVGWVSYGIIISNDNVCEATDAALLTAEGTYISSMSQPDTNGHYGAWLEQWVYDANWRSYSRVVRIPANYSGTKYIFVCVKNGGQYQFFPSPWNLDDRDNWQGVTVSNCGYRASAYKGSIEKAPKKISEENTYAFPNPFEGKTTIRFSLDKGQKVQIVISDMNGKGVWQKEVTGVRGLNYVEWDARNSKGKTVGSGAYLMKVITEEAVITKKIAVVR